MERKVVARISTELEVTSDGITEKYQINAGDAWNLMEDGALRRIEKDGMSTVIPQTLLSEFFEL